MSGTAKRIDWLDEATGHDLIRHFPLPMALLDDAGAVLALNDRFEQAYGTGVPDLEPLQALIRDPLPGWHRVRVPGRGPGEIEIRAQVLRLNGHPVLIVDDAPDSGLDRQLDQLRGQVVELERLSSTDRLTGAWNRTHLDRVVAPELDRSLRHKQPVSIILVEIDHFKEVTDTCGRQAGDSVLWELAQVIGAVVRTIDALFRWGDDKFAVLASSTGYRGSATLAERIRSKVEQHSFGGIGSMTISLGVAEHLPRERAEKWFQRADEALDRARSGGRNRVVVDRRGSSDLWASEGCPSVVRLVWQEAHECGEPAIDRDHRELFGLANALLDASFKTGSSPAAFNAALDQLLAHVTRCVAGGESMPGRSGDEDLDARRQSHDGLIARAGELKASVATGKTTVGDLVDFLAKTMVVQHLFNAEREFYPLFRKPATQVTAIQSH